MIRNVLESFFFTIFIVTVAALFLVIGVLINIGGYLCDLFFSKEKD